jgi:hypothetical protein
VKVTHFNDEHLISLSSEEAALFVDVCHAAIFSDFMPQDPETQNRLMLLLGQVQIGLLPTAQCFWEQQKLMPSIEDPPGLNHATARTLPTPWPE